MSGLQVGNQILSRGLAANPALRLPRTVRTAGIEVKAADKANLVGLGGIDQISVFEAVKRNVPDDPDGAHTTSEAFFSGVLY